MLPHSSKLSPVLSSPFAAAVDVWRFCSSRVKLSSFSPLPLCLFTSYFLPFPFFVSVFLFSTPLSLAITIQGTVYDYIFLWETKKWVPWMKIIDKFEVDSKLSFSEIVVPTADSVRNTYLLDLLLSNDKHILLVGGTGTGKTVNISQYLMGAAKVQGKRIFSS